MEVTFNLYDRNTKTKERVVLTNFDGDNLGAFLKDGLGLQVVDEQERGLVMNPDKIKKVPTDIFVFIDSEKIETVEDFFDFFKVDKEKTVLKYVCADEDLLIWDVETDGDLRLSEINKLEGKKINTVERLSKLETFLANIDLISIEELEKGNHYINPD